MTNKSKAETAQVATPAKNSNATPVAETKNVQTVTDLLKQRLLFYGQLHKKVNQRDTLQVHKDTLEGLKIPQSIQPFEEQEKLTEKIVIHIGYRDEYEIKNVTLMHEVRNFLVSKLETKIKELEVEILETTI